MHDSETETGPDAESYTGRTVRGAQLALVGWISSNGIQFGAYVALARLISPRGFGDFAAASVILGVGALAAEGGMMSALITRRDRIEEAASTAFFTLLISGVLLTAAAAAVSPLFGLFFRSSRIEAIVLVLSGGLFLHAAAVVPDSLLQRRLSFARRVAIDPLAAVMFAVASVVVAADGGGPWALVAGAYASLLSTVVAGYGFARFRPSYKRASFGMWRELSRYGRPVILSEVLRRIAGQLDTIMLGRFSGAPALGQYRNGSRLATQPIGAFVGVGSYVFLPVLFRIADDSSRLAAAVRRIYRVAGAIVCPVTVALIPLGVPIAVLTLGARWRLAGHAIAGLSGVLLGDHIVSISAETAKAIHRPDRLTRIHTVTLVTMAVFVLSVAIPFGLLGVSIAVSMSYCVTGFYAYWLLSPLVGVGWRDLAGALGVPALSSAAMALAMYGFGQAVGVLHHGEAAGLALLAAEVGIGAVVYLALLLTLDRSRVEDLRRLVSLRGGSPEPEANPAGAGAGAGDG